MRSLPLQGREGGLAFFQDIVGYMLTSGVVSFQGIQSSSPYGVLAMAKLFSLFFYIGDTELPYFALNLLILYVVGNFGDFDDLTIFGGGFVCFSV